MKKTWRAGPRDVAALPAAVLVAACCQPCLIDLTVQSTREWSTR